VDLPPVSSFTGEEPVRVVACGHRGGPGAKRFRFGEKQYCRGAFEPLHWGNSGSALGFALVPLSQVRWSHVLPNVSDVSLALGLEPLFPSSRQLASQIE